jgi:hypothetical protein
VYSALRAEILRRLHYKVTLVRRVKDVFFFSADARMLELNCTFSVKDINYKKFDVLVEVVMNITVFCYRAPCMLVDKWSRKGDRIFLQNFYTCPIQHMAFDSRRF